MFDLTDEDRAIWNKLNKKGLAGHATIDAMNDNRAMSSHTKAETLWLASFQPATEAEFGALFAS